MVNLKFALHHFHTAMHNTLEMIKKQSFHAVMSFHIRLKLTRVDLVAIF